MTKALSLATVPGTCPSVLCPQPGPAGASLLCRRGVPHGRGGHRRQGHRHLPAGRAAQGVQEGEAGVVPGLAGWAGLVPGLAAVLVQVESPLKYQHRCVSVFKDKKGAPTGLYCSNALIAVQCSAV